MKKSISAFLLMGTLLISTGAFAEDYPTYAGRKLGRGLTNIAFGWTEVLKGEERAIDSHGPVGLVSGTLDGLGNTVKRTAIGVFETLTFPFKTSENADPIAEPEFPARADSAGYRPKDYTF